MGMGIALGSVPGESDGGVAGLGMIPSRYPITPRDFAADIIDSFHSVQFEPSNFFSVGKTKTAGCECDIVVSSFG